MNRTVESAEPAAPIIRVITVAARWLKLWHTAVATRSSSIRFWSMGLHCRSNTTWSTSVIEVTVSDFRPPVIELRSDISGTEICVFGNTQRRRTYYRRVKSLIRMMLVWNTGGQHAGLPHWFSCGFLALSLSRSLCITAHDTCEKLWINYPPRLTLKSLCTSFYIL
jgi:hypothetical protein